MARTIKDIQDSIALELQNKKLKLSDSNVAEWRLWTYVFAAAIHSFEVILDLFKKEIDIITNKITPGTIRWYAEMCYRFQNGHELLFDDKTAMLYYAKEDLAAQIVKVVAVSEGVSDKSKSIFIKAAKLNKAGKVIPLSGEELLNFSCYIDAIKFAGIETEVISTVADTILYDIDVYFEPAIPNTIVRTNIQNALKEFKTAIGFDSMIYKQKFIDTIMNVEGVVTCNLKSLSRKSYEGAFVNIDIYSELQSGYFEYDEACILNTISIKELQQA